MVGDSVVWPGSELELSHFTLLWISILKKIHRNFSIKLENVYTFLFTSRFCTCICIKNYHMIICILKIFTFEKVNLMASDEIIFHSNKRSQCYFHHRNYKSVLPPTLDMWKVLMVYVESSVTSTRRTCITPYVSAPLWGQY